MLDEPKNHYFSFPPDKLFTGPRNRRLLCGWKNQSKGLNFGLRSHSQAPKFAESGVEIDSRVSISHVSLDTFFRKKVSEKNRLFNPLRLATCCLIFIFASFSCKDSPSASDNTKVTLTFEDASCIETWLQLRIENATPPYSVALSRDGSTLATLHIVSSDTLLIDEGLAPSTTYTYRASLTLDNNIVVHSSDAPARTMDTTSHNWNFDPPVLLGDGSSSALYDVAIINDTLAYAVGEIYKQDSLGNWDPLPYNLVKWDGQQWHLQRVSVFYRGSLITPPLNAIFAFSATDIWLSSGVPIHGDGANWIQYHLFDMGVLTQNDGSINKIWGSNSTNLWFVGNRGTIVHYDGTRWTRLESGTVVDINDVWSSVGGNSRLTLATASNRYSTGEKKLLRIGLSGVVDTLSWSPQSRLHTVWFSSARKLYIGGGKLYSGWTGNWTEVIDLPFFFSTRIRGTEYNNVWVVGAFGLCGHFNGVSWYSFSQVSLPNGTLEGLAVTDRIIIAVGQVGNRGAVVSGVRQ